MFFKKRTERKLEEAREARRKVLDQLDTLYEKILSNPDVAERLLQLKDFKEQVTKAADNMRWSIDVRAHRRQMATNMGYNVGGAVGISSAILISARPCRRPM